MARRLGWLGLLAFLMLGAAVWTLWPAPCSKPVAYRLGPVDDRFGLSGDEVLAALGEAGALWEHGLGRKLFTYDPRWQGPIRFLGAGRLFGSTVRGGRPAGSLGERVDHVSGAVINRRQEEG